MRSLKVVCTYLAKTAGITAFLFGFYLILIIQFFTGITGFNVTNGILIIFGVLCGYIVNKILLKVPIVKFEKEENEKEKLKGLDLFIVRLIAVILILIALYFCPDGSDTDYLRR